MKAIRSRMLVGWTMVSLAVSAEGQGYVNFDTSVVGIAARVYDMNGTLVGSGSSSNWPSSANTNFFAQLHAASNALMPLVAVGNPVNFRRGSGAGYVQRTGTTTLGWIVNPVVTISSIAPGGPAFVQLRVWWGGPTGTEITNYEAAVSSSNPNSRWGVSPILYLPATAVPPNPPVELYGLEGFQLSQNRPGGAPAIVRQPQSQAVYRGEDVTFIVTASGAEPLSYQWRFNGTDIVGAITTNFTVLNVQAPNAGNYTVVVTNTEGAVTSLVAVLTVRSSAETLGEVWVQRYNGPRNGDDGARAVAVDTNGNVYVTGYSTGSSGTDYTTIKYSSAGVPLWTNRYNGPADGDDVANALALDDGGDVYVTGYSTGNGSYKDYATIQREFTNLI